MLNSCTSIGWIHAVLLYGFVVGRRNVARCSGAEPSNANISFPEHFEGKQQSGERCQKDCLPLLSTFCKFQRLKVKGSQVMLVCASIATVAHKWSGVAADDVDRRQGCAGCPVIQIFCALWQPCLIVRNFTHGYLLLHVVWAPRAHPFARMTDAQDSALMLKLCDEAAAFRFNGEISA